MSDATATPGSVRDMVCVQNLRRSAARQRDAELTGTGRGEQRPLFARIRPLAAKDVVPARRTPQLHPTFDRQRRLTVGIARHDDRAVARRIKGGAEPAGHERSVRRDGWRREANHGERTKDHQPAQQGGGFGSASESDVHCSGLRL